MKRIGRLFDDILGRDNLRLAAFEAGRGKRHRAGVRTFLSRLDANLGEMAERLRAGTFPVGRFDQFVIRDPKERIITAPCFPERVLHHAVMNVCEPHFESRLIADTFACRTGKGRIAALLRARQFAGRFGYFLVFDIRKYFDSIDHEMVLDRLRGRFKDARLLHLLERIVRSFRSGLGRGLPIGSLTSQHLANFYLGPFDRFAKETLRIPGYVRYMDDVAMWSDDRTRLKEMLGEIETFLRDELALELKPGAYSNRTRHGMDFLGCRVFRRHMTLSRKSRVRYRRKLMRLEREHLAGNLTEGELQQRATALTAFARTEGVSSWRFRRTLLQHPRRAVEGLEPGDPGRELEQQRQELPFGEPQQEHAVEPEQQHRVPGRPSSDHPADAGDGTDR